MEEGSTGGEGEGEKSKLEIRRKERGIKKKDKRGKERKRQQCVKEEVNKHMNE